MKSLESEDSSFLFDAVEMGEPVEGCKERVNMLEAMGGLGNYLCSSASKGYKWGKMGFVQEEGPIVKTGGDENLEESGGWREKDIMQEKLAGFRQILVVSI